MGTTDGPLSGLSSSVTRVRNKEEVGERTQDSLRIVISK
jgi:hypothetical protein